MSNTKKYLLPNEKPYMESSPMHKQKRFFAKQLPIVDAVLAKSKGNRKLSKFNKDLIAYRNFITGKQSIGDRNMIDHVEELLTVVKEFI